VNFKPNAAQCLVIKRVHDELFLIIVVACIETYAFLVVEHDHLICFMKGDVNEAEQSQTVQQRLQKQGSQYTIHIAVCMFLPL